jgi:hypothetical protein
MWGFWAVLSVALLFGILCNVLLEHLRDGFTSCRGARIATGLLFVPGGVVSIPFLLLVAHAEYRTCRWPFTFKSLAEGGIVLGFVIFWCVTLFFVLNWVLAHLANYPPVGGRESRVMPWKLLLCVILALAGISSLLTLHVNGYVTLAMAVDTGDINLVKKRVKFNLQGVGIDNGQLSASARMDVDPQQFSLLPSAAKHGNPKLIRFLLDLGADPNGLNWSGTSAIEVAVIGLALHTSREWHEIRMAPDSSVETKIEAYYDGVRKRDHDMVRLLLDAGADCMTALEAAREYGDQSVIDFVKDQNGCGEVEFPDAAHEN